jgi:RNA polymerase sigma-70 factor (ECF subfamily)
MPSDVNALARVAGAFDYDGAIAACAKGNRDALKALYDRDGAQMLGVAARMLRRRAAAEDVVQDTFVQIWHKAATFDPTLGSGRTWMYAILRNRALNVLRAEARLDSLPDTESASFEADPEHPQAILERLSDESALRRCLEQLEPARRAAIIDVYTLGLSHGEVAGRYGTPLGTMKSWIRRGLLALRECLNR